MKRRPATGPTVPPRASEAHELIRNLLLAGNVTFTGHALREMAKDNLTTQDILNVLRGGVLEGPEYENSAWRYRARTSIMATVVEIDGAVGVVVVTAWRNDR